MPDYRHIPNFLYYVLGAGAIFIIMNIDFNALKAIVRERLEGEADLAEFDKVWKIKTSQNERMIYQWLGEALLNDHLSFIEIGKKVTKYVKKLQNK